MSEINEQVKKLKEFAEKINQSYPTCEENHKLYDLLSNAADTIESLFRNQTAGGWIPCSERLPEEDGFYLVTLTDKITDIVDIRIMKIYFSKTSKIFVGYGDTVIAWQPLPAPYEVKSDE